MRRTSFALPLSDNFVKIKVSKFDLEALLHSRLRRSLFTKSFKFFTYTTPLKTYIILIIICEASNYVAVVNFARELRLSLSCVYSG